MRRLTAFTATAVFALAGATAQADIFKPSKSQQIQLGKDASKEVKKKERVLPSYDDRVELVRRIGNRLVGTMDESDRKWEFTFDVIESKEVNAFALPGGPMYVYTGLIDKLETEDQLAGVLAHEIHHVTEEHWARNYADSQKRGLLFGILLGATGANKTWQSVAGVIDFAKYTAYSRGAETEADDEGYTAMVEAGYNPKGLTDVFRMFQKAKKGGAGFEWASTHPSDQRRIDHIENKMRNSGRDFPAQRPLRY